MAINTGKLRIGGVDMDEIVSAGINLFHSFWIALCENQVAGSTIAGFDRHRPVVGDVFAIVATETTVPVFVPDKIGMRAPIDLHFGKKIRAIESLRLLDDRPGLGPGGIRFVQ